MSGRRAIHVDRAGRMWHAPHGTVPPSAGLDPERAGWREAKPGDLIGPVAPAGEWTREAPAEFSGADTVRHRRWCSALLDTPPGLPCDCEAGTGSGMDRVLLAIEEQRGEFAPAGPVTLCGAPDGTERRSDDPALPSVHDYDPLSPDGVPLPPVRENRRSADDARTPRWIAAEDAIRAARRRQAPPEELFDLMVEVADAVAEAGFPDAARSIHRSADALLPLFGLNDRRPSVPWWRRFLGLGRG